jgi:hypothetical protein
MNTNEGVMTTIQQNKAMMMKDEDDDEEGEVCFKTEFPYWGTSGFLPEVCESLQHQCDR